jgi:hypothetical protein
MKKLFILLFSEVCERKTGKIVRDLKLGQKGNSYIYLDGGINEKEGYYIFANC